MSRFLLLISFTAAVCAQASYVWWEAENPVEQRNVRVHQEPADSEYGKVVSDQGWIEPADQAGAMMSATYEVDVPASGEYHLWVRKFWRHGPFRWRFDNGEWRSMRKDTPLHDDAYIMKNIGANWVYLGETALEAGPHAFEFENLENRGFVDCFLLIDEPFRPAGRLKPGERSGESEDGYFAWEPGADDFRESPIDLRRLNETYAGEHGFIRREGDRFVYGDGRPVRFWMTQAGNLLPMQPHMQERHARRLAKYGVNLTRFVMLGAFRAWRSGDTAEFEHQLDQLHRTVATLKENGVYVYLGHLFWDTHVASLHDNELPGLKRGEKATAALFFNEPLQAYYLEWIRALMTPVNPYTGLPLAKDPAIAFIEVQNESNSLFWTLNPGQLPRHTVDLMQTQFAAFAAEKHGSLEAAFQHWGESQPGDDLEAQKAGILGAWALTTQGPANVAKRAADQIEFQTQAQYALYAKMKQAFRKMGIESMVAGSNWKTADPSNLGPLEHYSYTAVDVVNKNEYFSPRRIHNPRYYQVETGDQFTPLSAMRAPEIAGALMTAQLATHPYMITENNWDEPNLYRLEWPFLVATYGAVAGVDGWNFFAYDTPMWYVGNNTWSVNTPEVMGQFPAYALMFRRGDVRTGSPAVEEHLPLQRLYERKPIALPEIQYKDELWQRALGGDPQVDFKSEFDPKAFFAGPVRLHLGASERRIQSANLDDLIDEEAGVIRNTNEQLEWRYGDGYVSVDTARSQGVCGFLGDAGAIELSDAHFTMGNEYGSLVAVSLDDQPLAASQSILLQAGAPDKSTGFELQPLPDGGYEVVAMGAYPLQVETIDATITLRGKANFTVTALDELGYPTDLEVATEKQGEALRITFPPDAIYLHVAAP